MKDSQQNFWHMLVVPKYIKANNERFSTHVIHGATPEISISRRIMKDSQPVFTGARRAFISISRRIMKDSQL